LSHDCPGESKTTVANSFSRNSFKSIQQDWLSVNMVAGDSHHIPGTLSRQVLCDGTPSNTMTTNFSILRFNTW